MKAIRWFILTSAMLTACSAAHIYSPTSTLVPTNPVYLAIETRTSSPTLTASVTPTSPKLTPTQAEPSEPSDKWIARDGEFLHWDEEDSTYKEVKVEGELIEAESVVVDEGSGWVTGVNKDGEAVVVVDSNNGQFIMDSDGYIRVDDELLKWENSEWVDARVVGKHFMWGDEPAPLGYLGGERDLENHKDVMVAGVIDKVYTEVIEDQGAEKNGYFIDVYFGNNLQGKAIKGKFFFGFDGYSLFVNEMMARYLPGDPKHWVSRLHYGPMSVSNLANELKIGEHYAFTIDTEWGRISCNPQNDVYCKLKEFYNRHPELFDYNRYIVQYLKEKVAPEFRAGGYGGLSTLHRPDFTIDVAQ